MPRKIPGLLQSILVLDRSFTSHVCSIADRFMITRSLKRHARALEYSCHGIVWLVSWLLLTWILWNPSLFQMQVNFFIGLILDIIFIAVLKAVTRRRRPVGNKDNCMSVGPDKYSFPSGHVSRAFFITYFFFKLYPCHTIFFPPLIAWCFSVSFSRILLKRHHVLDVLAGSLLGIFEGILISFIWLSRSSATYLIEWITDEHFDGGEFHV